MPVPVSNLPPQLQLLLDEAERLAIQPRDAALAMAQPSLPLASIALWHTDGIVGTVRAPRMQTGNEDNIFAIQGVR